MPSTEEFKAREAAPPPRSAEPDDPFRVGPGIRPAAGYVFLRGLIRVWFKLLRRPVRLLGHESSLPASGPAIVIAAHPATFQALLIFIAAFNRPLRCFLGGKSAPGIWARMFGRVLGLLPDDGDQPSFEAACRAGERGEALLAFAEPDPSSMDGGRLKLAKGRAAQLAAELAKRLGGVSRLAVVPAHLFLPQPPLVAAEVLIHLEPPVRPGAEEGTPPAGVAMEPFSLPAALETAFRRNAFRLRPADLRDFLADVEDALRQDLEAKPLRPPERRPKLEGFVLSEFLAEWAEQENQINPACLVALRTELDSMREQHRAASLRDIEAETSGAWVRSLWKRAAAGAETMAGFPVAAFGFVNGICALVLLETAGLTRPTRAKIRAVRPLRWLAYGAIVLAVFAIQVFICERRWGRSAAGTYALALPVSVAYVWRYAWLLSHRSRLLVGRILDARARAGLDRQRGKWLGALGRAEAAYAERIGVAN